MCDSPERQSNPPFVHSSDFPTKHRTKGTPIMTLQRHQHVCERRRTYCVVRGTGEWLSAKCHGTDKTKKKTTIKQKFGWAQTFARLSVETTRAPPRNSAQPIYRDAQSLSPILAGKLLQKHQIMSLPLSFILVT